MSREVVALVSVDDVVSAVRVHADRVHDLLRRSGCGPAESIEVCESYAFALVDALVNAPETVGDMAGWWFGRALDLGRRLGDAGAEPAGEAPASVLSGTSGEAQVRAALAQLPEQERAAVMLRDAYDLPPEAVAAALGRSVDAAAAVVAAGRLQLIARYDDRVLPDLGGHTGRAPVDIGMLSGLADGSLPMARRVPLRRHLGSCRTCEDVVELMAKARRLVAGLPIVAMPDEAREAMIERVAGRAVSVLPSTEEVMLAVEEDDEDRPAVSPVVIVIAIVLALVLGVAVAAATTLHPSGGSPLVDNNAPSISPAQPSFSVSPTPHHRSKSPTPQVTSAAPTATATSTATPSSTVTATATTRSTVARITLSPSQGPRGTRITVSGTGFPAGSVVILRYTGALASSTSSAATDGSGAFTGHVQANGALPGDYTVSAKAGSKTATATYRQTS